MGEPSTESTSRISLYEGSTQYRHWRFSPEQLADTRANLNAAAVTAIRDAFEADTVSNILLFFLDGQLNNPIARVILAGLFLECR